MITQEAAPSEQVRGVEKGTKWEVCEDAQFIGYPQEPITDSLRVRHLFLLDEVPDTLTLASSTKKQEEIPEEQNGALKNIISPLVCLELLS